MNKLNLMILKFNSKNNNNNNKLINNQIKLKKIVIILKIWMLMIDFIVLFSYKFNTHF